jgi:PAS domain S-box-containing protein
MSRLQLTTLGWGASMASETHGSAGESPAQAAQASVGAAGSGRPADVRVAQLQEAVELCPDPLVLVGSHGRIELLNERMVSLYGYPRAELVGRPLESLIRRASEGCDDLVAVREDGSELPVETSSSPIETEGETWIATTIRDVSERRRVEQRMEEANRL